ncbi:TetR/AcrR family transcriptional regulator [Duganella callida]|uniref:TetR/AcrR family transcriptional regulator n=1 Tax=Duganella callida TaxID=2561932 RepID=A0A4Y9SRF4_9BURK|nr:TetR/AcrR family transcriptional regulator [Duganella callida]TFW29270.1 TetR/AcrR family transcriptional regulator [Duganella callida]
MRKSKAETAETRKRIVAVASSVFPRRGLSGAGVGDVMEAAGMTLGGFYRHFESKEQLIAEASEAAFREFVAASDAAVAGKPPREALEIIVRIYLHQLEVCDGHGLCPLANLASELRHADPQIRAVADAGYARMVRRFGSYLAQLAVRDCRRVAEAIVTTIVGAVALSQLGSDQAAREAILANAEDTVRLLVDSGIA